MNRFNKILIANRGEIAVRIIRTAKAMGYRTVAVYSEADSQALHVQVADQAVCIGAAAVGESYLVAKKLLEAAQLSGADAIHPGYGFLSENAEFAKACEAADITFIGPSSQAIELMGSKRLSKIAMLDANVPCIPGYQGSDQTDEHLIAEAQKIGFPLMVKASAGGGGRGMRLVLEQSELQDSIKTARSEAQIAFGDDELILERAVMEPRHIEIQVFADHHGNVVYLGERDCSIQRRHQKVVEEAPSPFVDSALRQSMGEAAVNAAKACQYRGAGTVEFLVDADKHFYFLEMNTRLQVEHPVTELITGLDLVAWQLNVAAGEALPMSQSEITFKGHAMEVRLYAEDPSNHYLPQTGEVKHWIPADSEGIRIDHGIREGQNISSHYDPMLAKIITHGNDRENARRRLVCAVEDTVLLGVNSNKHFLANILRHDVFAQGQATTAFLEQHFSDDISIQANVPSAKALSLAAALMYIYSGQTNTHNPDLLSWINSAVAPCHYILRHNHKDHPIKLIVESNDNGIHCTAMIDDAELKLQIISIDDNKCTFVYQRVRETLDYVFDDDRLFINTESGNTTFENVTYAPASSSNAAGSGHIVAPMDGAVIDVLVSEGDQVASGQTLLILEAMKMEHQLKADTEGVLENLLVKQGDQVKVRQLLVNIASNEAE